jgi:hypothetical protein
MSVSFTLPSLCTISFIPFFIECTINAAFKAPIEAPAIISNRGLFFLVPSDLSFSINLSHSARYTPNSYAPSAPPPYRTSALCIIFTIIVTLEGSLDNSVFLSVTTNLKVKVVYGLLLCPLLESNST